MHGSAASRAKFLARAATWPVRRLLRMVAARPAVPAGSVALPLEEHPRLLIAIWAGGGLGDLVSVAGYVERLYLEHGCPDIDVFHAERSYLDFLFHDVGYVRRALPYAAFDLLRPQYDVVVQVHRTATYEICRPDRVADLAPTFWWCVHESNKRNDGEFAAHIQEMPYLDGDLAKRAGYKNLRRKSLLGYSGAVELTDETWIPFAPARSGLDVFQRFDLVPGRYITIHDGYDTLHASSGRSTKQWNIDSWRELIVKLRARFAGYKIVQLGGKNSCRFADVDVDLVGRIGFRQVAWLVKHAACHIDNESGIVRMARELGGRSVVIFGPTDPAFFGFDENINLRPRLCGNCFWSTRDWLMRCPRGLDAPECTHSVSVDDVLAATVTVVQERTQGTLRLAHATLLGDAPAPLGARGGETTLASAEAQYVARVLAQALPSAASVSRVALLAPAPLLADQMRQAGADVTIFAKDFHARARAAAEDPDKTAQDVADLRHGDAFHLGTASGSFDSAVLSVQAQPRTHELLALREALRVVRPGGCLAWSLFVSGNTGAREPAQAGPVAYDLPRLAAVLRELGVADQALPTVEDVAVAAAALRRQGVTPPSVDYALLTLVIVKDAKA